MTDFTELVDLASERLGGAVLSATDDFFAPKENLLKWSEPAFLPDEYTDAGKWMDGWETRRHRAPDHDWCTIKLGAPGIVRAIVVDTAHFKGNFPEKCSLEGSDDQEHWTELLPPSDLRGDSKNLFTIEDPYRYTHLRFRIYPDGGVARLRVHGEAIPERLGDALDLAAAHNGGSIGETTDMFFGSRHNLIFPERSTGMHDGWETRRRRGPGHDWCVVNLATEGEIWRVEVDTLHYKGNFPVACSLETIDGVEILPQSKLQAHTLHAFENELRPTAASAVRFHIYPDGGVSRLRIWGTPTPAGRARHRVRLVNSLPPASAIARLLGCCGSRLWADRMAASRPFASHDAMMQAAERNWAGIGRPDSLEAFAAHPRIGERTADAQASVEQSGTRTATRATLEELARLNHEYEVRFGHIYIVCAAGKTADEMLAVARERLLNDPARELEVAQAEQLAITKLRLERIG